MAKNLIDKEKALKELKEKLTDERLVSALADLQMTPEEFHEVMGSLISMANYWYLKGYEDAKNGGDVIDR